MILLFDAANTASGAELPKDFFTLATLGTLAGSTGAVLVVCSTAQSVFNFNPKWLALAVAILVSYIVAYVSATDSVHPHLKYVVAFFNGCLIYVTAVGSNNLLSHSPAGPGGLAGFAGGRRKFFSRWWS